MLQQWNNFKNELFLMSFYRLVRGLFECETYVLKCWRYSNRKTELVIGLNQTPDKWTWQWIFRNVSWRLSKLLRGQSITFPYNTNRLWYLGRPSKWIGPATYFFITDSVSLSSGVGRCRNRGGGRGVHTYIKYLKSGWVHPPQHTHTFLRQCSHQY